jgi:hypothetical protein
METGPVNETHASDRIDPGPSLLRRYVHLLWGAVPAVTVATIIPLVLFYGVSAWAGSLKAGIIASLSWAWVMLLRQIMSKRRISGLLSLTAITLTIRCVTWAVHQSTFTYFAVPVAETVVVGTLFVATMALGRPLLLNLAHDFVPSLAEHLCMEKYRPLVRRMSLLWGVVYLGSAATSAILLSTQSMHWFLLMHQFSGWCWTGSGIALSMLYGRHHAKELFALVHAGVAPRASTPAAALA